MNSQGAQALGTCGVVILKLVVSMLALQEKIKTPCGKILQAKSIMVKSFIFKNEWNSKRVVFIYTIRPKGSKFMNKFMFINF